MIFHFIRSLMFTVFKYLVAWCQRTDIRKSLVRLEQGASSSKQRDISNRGAFAVFYGRYLKHYIKKSKVCAFINYEQLQQIILVLDDLLNYFYASFI